MSEATFRGRIFDPWEEGYTPRTLLELHMRAAIGAVLNKRAWWTKWRASDDSGVSIRDKWLDELERRLIAGIFEREALSWRRRWLECAAPLMHAPYENLRIPDELSGMRLERAAPPTPNEDLRIPDALSGIRACIANTLEREIENNNLNGARMPAFVSPGPVQETWMSDYLIVDELKKKFSLEVAELENIPDDQKDWHPDSNEQVLDLVHPSLYCCVFWTTLGMSPTMIDAIPATMDVVERTQRMLFGGTERVENPHASDTDFQWIPSDFAVAANGNVEIRSYINNLHPKRHRGMYDSIARIFEAFVPMFDRVLSSLLNPTGPAPELEYGARKWDQTHELPTHPPIPETLLLHTHGPDFTLRGKKAQVIVKIAEIVLTPENPRYHGGSWHVEGSGAEQIVATGIYYFGCENIAESKLSFRVIVHAPWYQQDDSVGMRVMYGLDRDSELMQSLGSVTAIEDRCVVFPNTLQHRVEPFELADKTKPGVRKILAFFLVDPSKQIPSTMTIPPQQADWFRDAMDTELDQLQRAKALPDGVIDIVKAMLCSTDDTMTLEDAQDYRLLLMEERKEGADFGDNRIHTFSMCEH